ncbi:MAG: DUF547 domain-containing protein [Crocinitomicaceae bacterium]|nr:DUF547 domain-containing protein [Crocinitomicaceae bacterium]
MKIITLPVAILLSISCICQISAADFFNKADDFFNSYTSVGTVDYSSIKSNVNELDELVNYIATTQLDSLNENETKSLLINAYNLFVIKQVVDHFPIDSPLDIPGFFDNTKFNVGGNNYTLNHIENKILRKKYKDPRFHFSLVCAAAGCPPIVNFAYTPDNLDKQLNEQTRLVLNDSRFVYEKDNMVYISEIFKWYKDDFEDSDQSTLDYINSYRDEPFSSVKIKFYPYNWMLNNIPMDNIPDSVDLLPFGDENSDEIDLLKYTAGTLLKKGQWDFTLFNTMYTQTKLNWLGVDYNGVRESFYTSLIQATYGISKNKRINIGVDINFKSSARSSDSSARSVFRAFDFENNDSTRVGISSVGARIKVAPFKGNDDFSIQSSFYMPTIEHPEGYTNPDGSGEGNLYWSDWDRYTSLTQFFYSKAWEKFQLFTEVDLLFRIRRNKEQITHLDIPFTVAGGYFLTSKFTLYGIAQHNSRFTYDVMPHVSTDWVIPMSYTTLGAGMKYQLMDNLILELLYTNFVHGRNSGIGSTFNLGIKYLTR